MAALRNEVRQSWTSSKARSSDLLYASTGIDGAIYVYAYPKGELVSGLFNSGNSYGLCSDPKGDVFVTNDYAIYEYRHGGAGPSAVLTNPFGATFSCSFDPATGNLAALTSHDALIFQPGRHGWKQAKFIGPSYPTLLSCGYDGSGNLFIGGYATSGYFIAELQKGKSNFIRVLLNRQFPFGNIQWDGKFVAIGDNFPSYPSIHRFKFTGTTGRQVGVTKLNVTGTMSQFWIQGGIVSAGVTQSGSYAVGLWAYPAGGNPQQLISQDRSDGVTVSLAQPLK
jgi:hypothetical protein